MISMQFCFALLFEWLEIGDEFLGPGGSWGVLIKSKTFWTTGAVTCTTALIANWTISWIQAIWLTIICLWIICVHEITFMLFDTWFRIFTAHWNKVDVSFPLTDCSWTWWWWKDHAIVLLSRSTSNLATLASTSIQALSIALPTAGSGTDRDFAIGHGWGNEKGEKFHF